MNEKEVYAFWGYDLYPYLCYGKVTKFVDNETVLVDGYGNSSFRYRFLVPGSRGKALTTQLDNLKRDRQKELDTIESDYKIQLKGVLNSLAIEL